MAKRMLIEATGQEFVGYFGPNGRQIDRGYLIEKRPAAPPAGTVYERTYTLLKDVTTEDGELIEKLDSFPLTVGSKTFLRGRVVTDPKEATTLLMPPFVRRLVGSVLQGMIEAEVRLLDAPTIVAVNTANEIEVGIPLQEGDTPPPADANPYAVGESPEEVSEAELAAIREDVKDGVYDDEEFEAAAEEMYRSTWETVRDEAGGEN